MSDINPTPVEEPTKQKLVSRLKSKKTVAKVAAITGGAVVAAVWLKKKLNCACDVDGSATFKVETDNDTSNS